MVVEIFLALGLWSTRPRQKLVKNAKMGPAASRDEICKFFQLKHSSSRPGSRPSIFQESLSPTVLQSNRSIRSIAPKAFRFINTILTKLQIK